MNREGPGLYSDLFAYVRLIANYLANPSKTAWTEIQRRREDIRIVGGVTEDDLNAALKGDMPAWVKIIALAHKYGENEGQKRLHELSPFKDKLLVGAQIMADGRLYFEAPDQLFAEALRRTGAKEGKALFALPKEVLDQIVVLIDK